MAVMIPGCTQPIDLRWFVGCLRQEGAFQTLSVAVCSPEGGFEIRWSPGCSQTIDLRFQTLAVAVCCPEGGFQISWSAGCCQTIVLGFQTLPAAVCCEG